MSLESRKILVSTFQKMMEGIEGYTLILLDVDGTILTWNKGVENLKGYTSEEIIGQHVSMFYLPEDRQKHLPDLLLERARLEGRVVNTGRRIRRNGSIFWGSIEISAIKDDGGDLMGFTNLARELKDESDLGSFWFDNDGILHTKASRIPHTPEKIAAFREMLTSSLGSGKLCCIADIREAILTDEGLSFAQPEVANIYKAIAYISDPEIDSTTIKAMSILPKEIPVKIFTSREAAKSWIKTFI